MREKNTLIAKDYKNSKEAWPSCLDMLLNSTIDQEHHKGRPKHAKMNLDMPVVLLKYVLMSSETKLKLLNPWISGMSGAKKTRLMSLESNMEVDQFYYGSTLLLQEVQILAVGTTSWIL